MSRTVVVLPTAERDLLRLEVFLARKSLRAAARAAETIAAAVLSLGEMAERYPVLSSRGARELAVRFGRDGYVVQYFVVADEVLVARIFHAREAR